ncbi:MAG: divalent metal cation transporter [Thermoleophilia bacterium]|nr:divalent metal cation transporter [Thermoleophilia bacterium]
MNHRPHSHLKHVRRGTARKYGRLRKAGRPGLVALLAVAGPGLLAGLSDDDPAGITTYSVLGADFGYQLLWVVVLSTALLILFHLLAMRLGVATGRGFAAVIRTHVGHRWAVAFAALFVLANFGTICAEYAGIAAVTQLAGWPAWVGVLPALVVLSMLLVSSSFHRIEHLLVAVSALLALYIPAGFIAGVDWHKAAVGAVVPGGIHQGAAAVAIAATIGTTLAPWGLAFIQSYVVDKGLTPDDYRYERLDVVIGSLLTGLIGVFIVVACAATLHVAGVKVETARDVALALKPLAGDYAALLFGVGLLGAALLAAAIVPLATAYSVSEAFGAPANLDLPLTGEKTFYIVLVGISAIAAGSVLIPGLNLIKLIYFSQVVNAVLLLPQLVALVVLTSRRSLMGDLTLGRFGQVLGWFSMLVVAASVTMLGLSGL